MISTRFKLRDGLAVLDDDDDDDWENVPYPDSAGAGERAVTRAKYADRRALTPTASSNARTPFSDASPRGDASPETPGASQGASPPETPARDDGFVVVRRPRSHGMLDVLTPSPSPAGGTRTAPFRRGTRPGLDDAPAEIIHEETATPTRGPAPPPTPMDRSSRSSASWDGHSDDGLVGTPGWWAPRVGGYPRVSTSGRLRRRISRRSAGLTTTTARLPGRRLTFLCRRAPEARVRHAAVRFASTDGVGTGLTPSSRGWSDRRRRAATRGCRFPRAPAENDEDGAGDHVRGSRVRGSRGVRRRRRLRVFRHAG